MKTKVMIAKAIRNAGCPHNGTPWLRSTTKPPDT
jgi:hypothetical protein